MSRYLLPLVLAVCCLSVSAEEPLPKELPLDQEATALRSAESTGLSIYLHDRAAAAATDAINHGQFKGDKRVRGWVTQEQQGQIVVTFIDQTPAALYRVAVSSNGVAGPVTALENPTPLTSYESGAAVARAAALASPYRPCAATYNSVVLPLPSATSNSWAVYLLPGTTQNDVVPIGGSYRFTVSGSKIISQRGFTKTCIALHTGPNVAGLMITHLLDPIPTEAHVFWSLWAKKPIYVATPPNGTIWDVEGNEIKLVERKATGG